MMAQHKTSSLQNELLSRNELVHLAVLARDQLSKLGSSSRKKTERLVVHGDGDLHVGQQLRVTLASMSNVVHGVGSLLRPHRVEVADAQQRHVGGIQVVDQLHVAEHASVTTVVNVVVYG